MKDTPSDKPVADKLGLKPGLTVMVSGSSPPGLAEMVRASRADLVHRRRDGVDLIFITLRANADLRRIVQTLPGMKKGGAMWVLRPRGHETLTESVVQRAGLDAGLVDVKVVRYDDTFAAEKFVYRLADR